MLAFAFLKSLFKTPTFNPGEKVNRFLNGSQDRWDGRVLAQTAAGVLVEWPRMGANWEQPGQLTVQVG